MKTSFRIWQIVFVVLVTSCNNNNQSIAFDKPVTDREGIADPLPSWNEGKLKQAIIGYGKKVTDSTTDAFIPIMDRIATFDNDGTLWAERPLAWLSSRPFENPAAFPHPMAMPEYLELLKKEMAEADKFSQQAEDAKNAALEANNNSDSYSLLTVVFGMVMFLGAITSKINRLRFDLAGIVAAGIICIVALIFPFFQMPIASR